MNLLCLTLTALLVFTHGWKFNHFPIFSNPTETKYKWNRLEFNFADNRDRIDAEAGGNLKPTNAIPIDVQPHYYDKNRLKTFVTIPRFQDGIPYTLATVSDQMGANGPLLKPYPNYQLNNNNNGTNCDAITSAFRVAITECNQMWVIDSGAVGLDAQCPPQLLLIDLNSDNIIHRYRFSTPLYTPGASLFITPIVDVRDPPPRGSCRHAMVYIADVNYHGLVVYDYMNNNAWRIENRFMYPDPNNGLHSVAGESFVLMDGIFGMATDKKNLYFHPLASKMEYSVPLRVIDNSTLFKNNIGNMYEAFKPLSKRWSTCAASAMDSKNNLYCVTLNPIDVTSLNVKNPNNCWDSIKLSKSSEQLQFVSGMKVVRNPQGQEELWMISNRYQKMAAGTQNFNEVNFRVIVLRLGHRS